MKSCILLVLVVCIGVMGEDNKSFLDYYPQANTQDLFKMVRVQLTEQKVAAPKPAFTMNCPTIALPAPTNSIYELKPGHIKVVMAMGDSITAGMSAKDKSLLSLKEYRGLSYSIGGDSGEVTLPNILKQFTQTGYPVGPSTGVGNRDSAGTGLNAAESGDINSDMLSQAQWLVAKLKSMSSVNMQDDWKVLTIWIGSNNLCGLCNNVERNSATDFEKNIFAALDYLRQNVPRLFVNLLPNLDVTQIYSYKEGTCGFVHSLVCSCGTSSDPIERENVKKETINYQLKAYAIAAHYAALKDDDFAVVAQPFLTDLYIDTRSHLSAADCFHPSDVAHELAAVALWNNMLSPQQDKVTTWKVESTPICPNATTLLYTF